MAQDAQQFYNSIPPLTWYLLIGIFLLSTLSTFGILSTMHFYFDFYLIFFKFQIWRLLTSLLFIGPFGFNFIIHLFLFLQYSKEMEEDVCGRSIADYIWCLTLGAVVMYIVGGYFRVFFLGPCLLMYMVYIKCNVNPDANLTLMYVPFQVRAVVFPWAFMLLHVAMGQSPLVDFVGIIAGHFYYFIHTIYPRTFQTKILNTPSFLYRIFPKEVPKIQNLFARGYNWGGSGRKLRG